MDIHKPKAVHSWREFLVEIGTIICGILIALGLEQAVEAVHRSGEIRETREALHREIGRDMFALNLKVREDRCLVAKLDQLEGWAHGGPKPPFARELQQSLRSSVWDGARTGAVAYMPVGERLALAAFYSSIEDEMDRVRRIREHISELRGFHNLPAIGPAQRDEFLKEIGRARSLISNDAAVAPDIVRIGHDLGAEPAAPTAVGLSFIARVDNLCRESGVANA